MRIPPRHALAVVAAALVLTGCAGGGTSNAPVTSSAAPPASSSAPASTSAPRSTAPARTTSPPAPATTTTSPWHPPTITPGTALPGENITAEQAAALQQSVDEGHQPWRLDVQMVAEAYTRNRFGWEDIEVALADPHTAEVTNRPDQQRITLQLRQPVREGPTGIWIVVSGNYLG